MLLKTRPTQASRHSSNKVLHRDPEGGRLAEGGQEKTKEDLTATQGCYKDSKIKHFLVVPSDRRKVNGHKLQLHVHQHVCNSPSCSHVGMSSRSHPPRCRHNRVLPDS